jgi:FkbM family methyltransferase
MNFSRISRKSILGRVLRCSLKLIHPNTAVPILQGKLRGKKWVVGSCDHGCWLGSYEYEKQKLVSRIIQNRSVFYDIGANAGFYTLLGAEIVGKKGQVISFEPLPRNIYFLNKHIKLNHYTNVYIMEVAVSDINRRALFKEEGDHLTGHLSLEGQLEVQVITLDSLLDNEKNTSS